MTRFDIDDDEMFTRHTSKKDAITDFISKIGQKELVKTIASNEEELEYYNSAKIYLLRIEELAKEETVAKEFSSMFKTFNEKRNKFVQKLAKEKSKIFPRPKIWLIKDGKRVDPDYPND